MDLRPKNGKLKPLAIKVWMVGVLFMGGHDDLTSTTKGAGFHLVINKHRNTENCTIHSNQCLIVYI